MLDRINWSQKLSGSLLRHLNKGSNISEKPRTTLFTDGNSGQREINVHKTTTIMVLVELTCNEGL